MTTTSKAIREKRAETLAQMQHLAEAVKAEKRNFSAEERTAFDGLDQEQERLQASAEDMERIERLDGLSVTESRTQLRAQAADTRRVDWSATEDRNRAYAGWFFHGSRQQRREYWQAAERHGIDVSAPVMRFAWPRPEQRINVTTSTGAGGATVAVDTAFMRNLDVAMRYYGNVFQFARVVDTNTGAALPWPTLDDTGQFAEVTPEATGFTDQDLVFQQNTLHSYKYDSKFIKLSWELLEDSVLPLAELISTAAGQRMGRALNADIMVTGKGPGGTPPGPSPVMASVPVGATTAAPTAVTYQDILNLYFSVDPSYRDLPTSAWVFSDAFQASIHGLVDANGRPILLPTTESALAGFPRPVLMGKGFFVNNALAAPAAGAHAAIFGDLSKIIVRRVTGDGDEGGIHLMRLNERFADIGVVAYLAWGRFDGTISIASASNAPVKALAYHA